MKKGGEQRMIYVILAVIVVIAFWVLTTYNKFVTIKTRIRASIQEIGNQLKRQADLLPMLNDEAEKYLKHEKGIFKDLTDSRKQIVESSQKQDLKSMSDASDNLQKVMSQLRVVVESNPEIKGVEAITKLMDESRDSLDKVMYSRRVLIDLTADYNIMIVTFPSNLIAGLFSFRSEKGLVTPEEGAHLEVSQEELKTPKLN